MTFRLQYRRYRLPLKRAVRTAHDVMVEREGVLVRIEDESGNAGLGEAAPLAWFGCESVDEIAETCRQLGEKVDDEKIASLPGRLGCLRNALRAARAELGRAEAGGVERCTGEDAAHLAVAALVPAGRAALAEIAAKAAAGFRTFKWKVGAGDGADELALLDDVCAALPDGAKLRLDANGAWDRRSAERWLERSAERPVEFVEQPCFADAAQGAARRRRTDDLLSGLARDFPTPIALDESVAGDVDVERWIDAGWSGIFVIKPALHGDIDGVLAALSAAKADVVFSSALETAAGAKAALRHAFAWKGAMDATASRRVRALGFGVWPLFADARFDGPAAAPFLRREDVERIDAEAVWNALS